MALPGSHFTLNVYFLLFQVSLAASSEPIRGKSQALESWLKNYSVIAHWIQPPHLTDRETKERKGWVTCPTWLPAMMSQGSQDLGQAFCSLVQHSFCHNMVHIPRHEWKNTLQRLLLTKMWYLLMTLQAYTEYFLKYLFPIEQSHSHSCHYYLCDQWLTLVPPALTSSMYSVACPIGLPVSFTDKRNTFLPKLSLFFYIDQICSLFSILFFWLDDNSFG